MLSGRPCAAGAATCRRFFFDLCVDVFIDFLKGLFPRQGNPVHRGVEQVCRVREVPGNDAVAGDKRLFFCTVNQNACRVGLVFGLVF